jgi:hypothetical protein
MITIIEALDILRNDGVDSLDIYFAELIEDGATEWSVDVLCDPINDLAMCSWTWTISSLSEVKKMLEDDDYFVCADWEIITNRQFSNDVVSAAIEEWLISNAFDMTTRVIDIDDATGSGYVRELRNMDLKWEIDNSTPLITLVDESS